MVWNHHILTWHKVLVGRQKYRRMLIGSLWPSNLKDEWSICRETVIYTYETVYIYIYMKEGCLFVLFVMLRSPNSWPHSWYHWQALHQYRCIELVFIMFRLMVQKLLNIEQFLSLKIQLNYKRMILEENISWVTISHLGQRHRLH
jgi:hypothetical protein